MLGDLSSLSSSFDPILYIVQILTFVAFVGGAAGDAAGTLWLVWRGKRRWKAKLWSIALLFAALIMLWVGWSFHLLGFGANY